MGYTLMLGGSGWLGYAFWPTCHLVIAGKLNTMKYHLDWMLQIVLSITLASYEGQEGETSLSWKYMELP